MHYDNVNGVRNATTFDFQNNIRQLRRSTPVTLDILVYIVVTVYFDVFNARAAANKLEMFSIGFQTIGQRTNTMKILIDSLGGTRRTSVKVCDLRILIVSKRIIVYREIRNKSRRYSCRTVIVGVLLRQFQLTYSVA